MSGKVISNGLQCRRRIVVERIDHTTKTAEGSAMERFFRIKLQTRRFARRHRRLISAVRTLVVFSAAFGGAYRFIVGRRAGDSGYDASAFAIRASFMLSIR